MVFEVKIVLKSFLMLLVSLRAGIVIRDKGAGKEKAGEKKPAGVVES